MHDAASRPPELTGLAALRAGWQFARDPLRAMRVNYETYGPMLVIGQALPFVSYPNAALLGMPLILTAGAVLNREVLNNPAAWRSISFLPGGPRNSAARRLNDNLTRMTGRRHAHYRKLIAAPLHKHSVDALGEDMVRLAQEAVASWPTGAPIDLGQCVYRLVRLIAIDLLFGADRTLGYQIADMASHMMERKWSASAMSLRVNLPVTAYGRSLREAEALERCVIAWAEKKQGRIDARDLVSIIVNSPDPDGNPASAAAVARSIPALVTMTSEACQSSLIWASLLLAQHPHVARELLDELAGAPLSADAIVRLPRLDAVIKETMRILPPVPLQMRVAQRETALLGWPVPKAARLVLSAFVTNRMPDLYPEPDRFLPERWSTIDPSVFEYLVFSGGPRNCPGYLFGMKVMKVALAAMLTAYRLETSPAARFDYRVQPTLRPAGSVPVILRRQDGAFAAAPIRGNVRSLVRFPQ
jgi:cytochrome P450